MTVYYQHIGERLSARDFPRSLGTPTDGLKRFRFKDIEEFLQHLNPLEIADIKSKTQHLAPTGFQIWGIPSGAQRVVNNMQTGDYLSLVRLAALDVLSQYSGQVADRVVVLAEEPETHLHPHLRRKMRAVLERLAAEGWTVLTATHGPEFISFAQSQVVARLWRRGDDVAAGVFDTTSATDAVKFQERLDERGNHEMLFAHRVVLCEGKDDPWAIRSAMAKLDPNMDLDARSVSLVDTGGVGNVPDYAHIAKRLGMPWCAVTDEDRLPDGTIKPATKAARDKLGSLLGPGDLLVVWPVDLEACLGIASPKKATPNWQATNTDPKPLDQMWQDHPDFITTCKSIQGWLSK